MNVDEWQTRLEETFDVGGVAVERLKLVGDALWIDFADSGVAKSKLTPSAIDKAVGSSVTARNWNTVQTLAKMAGVQYRLPPKIDGSQNLTTCTD